MQDAEQLKSVTVLVPESVKRWLEVKAVERVVAGRKHGERSVNAVVLDLIVAARNRDGKAAA
jgi:hypothetical protein